MLFSLLVYGLIAVLSAIYLLQLFYKWKCYTRQIDKLPGPRSYPLVGNGLEMFSPPEKIMGAFYERYKKYGPIYRIWNGPIATVVIACPEYLEKLMNNYVNLEKTLMYKFMRPWIGRGLVTAEGAKWKHRRKILTPAFHFKMLEGFLEIMTEKSQDLVNVFAKKAAEEQEVELLHIVSMCTLDIIYESAMGLRSSILASEHENEYTKNVMLLSQYTVSREMKPWLHPDFIYRLSSEGKEYYRILNIINEETKRVIEQRTRYWEANKITNLDEEGEKLGIKKQSVFLDTMLNAVKNGEKLTADDIHYEVNTFLFAGHDTTGSAVTWVLLYLAMYPDVQEKVAKEMESIFQDSDRSPTTGDINDMKYLECVIKEILRLYPIAPFIGRTLAEDTKFGDYLIPAGTEVTMDLYSTHRNNKYFPNPEKFDPDNFLPDATAERHPYAFVPFSAGPRNCIGQRFAMLEGKTIVSTVVRNFKLETTVSPDNIELYRTILIAHKHGAPVKLIKRK